MRKGDTSDAPCSETGGLVIRRGLTGNTGVCPGSHTTERRVAAREKPCNRRVRVRRIYTAGDTCDARGRERVGRVPGFGSGFCMLFRALVRSRKKAAAISAKSEKGGGEVQSILLTREYPKMEPRGGVESDIQRLVLDVISKRKAQRKPARTEWALQGGVALS